MIKYAAGAVAQPVKCPELKFLKKRCTWADVSLIPGCSIGIREKILATPSVGVRGEAHVHRNKHVGWASSKKSYKNLAAGAVAQFEERPNKGTEVGLIPNQSIGR